MPVDLHPQEKIPGVELILTRLHAGGKFSGPDLHVRRRPARRRRFRRERAVDAPRGVDTARRQRIQHGLQGRRAALEARGRRAPSAEASRGTTLRFWPDPKYFDSPSFSLPRLKHLLRAKAVLLPGTAQCTSSVEKTGEDEEWCYEDGLAQYLARRDRKPPRLPGAARRRPHRRSSAKRPSGRCSGCPRAASGSPRAT